MWTCCTVKVGTLSAGNQYALRKSYVVRRIPFCCLAKARFLGNWRGVSPTHAWFAMIVCEGAGRGRMSENFILNSPEIATYKRIPGCNCWSQSTTVVPEDIIIHVNPTVIRWLCINGAGGGELSKTQSWGRGSTVNSKNSFYKAI